MCSLHINTHKKDRLHFSSGASLDMLCMTICSCLSDLVVFRKDSFEISNPSKAPAQDPPNQDLSLAICKFDFCSFESCLTESEDLIPILSCT